MSFRHVRQGGQLMKHQTPTAAQGCSHVEGATSKAQFRPRNDEVIL